MLRCELGLFVVVWLDWVFDSSRDLHRSCSQGFRSSQSFGHLGDLGKFLLHPRSQWMVLHIVCILRHSAPQLRSCSMVLLVVEVVCGSESVIVGLVCGTPPLG